MRDLKTYLSVAPVLSTLWFGSLAGLLIEINRLFPAFASLSFFIQPLISSSAPTCICSKHISIDRSPQKVIVFLKDFSCS
jgi:photosystem I subunit 9